MAHEDVYKKCVVFPVVSCDEANLIDYLLQVNKHAGYALYDPWKVIFLNLSYKFEHREGNKFLTFKMSFQKNLFHSLTNGRRNRQP